MGNGKFSEFSGSCLQDMNVFLSTVVLRYLGMLEHSLFPVHGEHGKEIYFPTGQVTKLKSTQRHHSVIQHREGVSCSPGSQPEGRPGAGTPSEE